MNVFDRKQQGMTTILIQGIIPVCIYYLVNQCVVILGMSVVGMCLQVLGVLVPYELYLRTVVQMAGMFLAAVSVISFYRKENIYARQQKSIREKKGLSAGNAMGIIVLGAIFSLGINYLFAALGFLQSSENYQQVAERQFSLPLWLALVFYGILSPWAEELVFRGIFYRVLRRNLSKMAAVFGAAFMFGIFHGNLVQMVYGILMGSIMALLYEKYQNLMAPILFHGAANTAIYTVTYFF